MKKLMYVAVVAMALGFTSCGADDVIDFACDTFEAELRAEVQLRIDAYNTEATASTCTNLKTAIDAYRSSDCGDDNAYASERNALEDDCSNTGV